MDRSELVFILHPTTRNLIFQKDLPHHQGCRSCPFSVPSLFAVLYVRRPPQILACPKSNRQRNLSLCSVNTLKTENNLNYTYRSVRTVQ